MRNPWTWGHPCPPKWKPARSSATGRPHALPVLVKWDTSGWGGWTLTHPSLTVNILPESALSAKRTNPPTPAMYKFRPAFPGGPKAPFCGPGEQVRRPH